MKRPVTWLGGGITENLQLQQDQERASRESVRLPEQKNQGDTLLFLLVLFVANI